MSVSGAHPGESERASALPFPGASALPLLGESEGASAPSDHKDIFLAYRYFPKETIGQKKVLQMQDFSIVWLS
jgi:hypothetical protein